MILMIVIKKYFFIIYNLLMLMISKVGLDLTLSCLSGISMLSDRIYSSIGDIITDKNHNQKIVNFINEIDILATVKIIENFVKEITIDETTPTTVNTCIEEIFNVLQKIEHEFDEINNKMCYNSSIRILKNLRSCKFDNSINRLITLKNILENRTNLLLKIIPVKNNLTKTIVKFHEYKI